MIRMASLLRLAFTPPFATVDTNPLVFFDVTVGAAPLERITIELFADVVPKTAENFRSLCTGERGETRWVPVGNTRCPLTFKGVPFHRIIPGFIVQGGDILYRDGRGSESIFGFNFPDESFDGKAGKNIRGTVAMANNGPNSNGSQFFFNLAKSSPHLDGKFVVFGQVIQGWAAVEFIGMRGSRSGTPTSIAWINECGQSGGVEVQELEDLRPERQPFLLPGKEVLNVLRPRSSQS